MINSVYLMPGMGANPIIFEFISLPDGFDVNLLSWILPEKNEPLDRYALRMCDRVKHKNPILIGVSFGGVLVQEMAKHIDCKKVIIISSVKSNEELPNHMKLAQWTNAHRLLPTQWIKNIETFALFVFGIGIQRRLEHYKRYLSERDPEYLNWAIDRLVNWNRNAPDQSVIHIHGAQDSVFPVKNIQDPFIKIEGDHAIILTKSDWFNKNLPKIMTENLADST
ncbi:MAG: alpha/beta hydrolase [Flavobacteriaceae bacterium]|nr:alpha/beta hydrolase [Flavobacteriaceae bacterium]MBL6692953.1 alpha/beta hydrolase [Flavobacteriaceae bacterium]